MIKYLTLITLILFVNSNLKAEPEGGSDPMKKNDQCQESVYRNVPTAPVYIKLKFKSPDTGKILNLVAENTEIAHYLASKQGVQLKDPKAFSFYIETIYVPYMTENENSILDIDINDFKQFISKARFGNKKAADKYVDQWIFDRPLKLEDLNVKNKDEFSEKFLKFDSNNSGSIKDEYSKQYASNPAFIALLIELGYNVGHGDIVPILWIRKC